MPGKQVNKEKNSNSNYISTLLFPVLFYAHEIKDMVENTGKAFKKTIKKSKEIFEATDIEDNSVLTKENHSDVKNEHNKTEIKISGNHAGRVYNLRAEKELNPNTKAKS